MLLRSLYLALGAGSDSNGCHPYHGWQYFAGRFSFKIDPGRNIYFLIKDLAAFYFTYW
jgi:hypothetical protein